MGLGSVSTLTSDDARAIKEEFDKAGICIPFPQRDVHLYRSAEA